MIRTGGAPSISNTASGLEFAAGGRERALDNPAPAAPLSGSRIRCGNWSVSNLGIMFGRSSCTLSTSTSCSRAIRSSAGTPPGPSHTLDVITTSRGPFASGRGPATARGTIVAPSASAATAGDDRHALRRRITASTTGSGEVSAA